ncbi:ATP-binding protein [Intestinibacter sp.]
MNTSDKILLLNNINLVIAITIVPMSILIYYLTKRSYYICFIIVCFIEAIVHVNFIKYSSYEGYAFSLECIFIIKILCLIINRNLFKASGFKKLLLIIICSVGLLLTSDYIDRGLIINLLGNLFLFYQYIYKVLSRINSDLSYVKVQTLANERYIDELNRDIHLEISYEEDLNEKEERLKNICDVAISKNKLPMLILEDNTIMYTNNQFDELFGKINSKEYNIKTLFKDYFYYGENIIKTIQSNNNFLSLDITSFKGEVYTLDVVNIMDENKIFKVFQFSDITTIHNMEETIKFNENNYKKLIEFMDDGFVIVDKNHINYMSKKVNKIFNIQTEISSVEDLSNYVSNIDKQNFIRNIVIDRGDEKNKTWYTNTSKNKVLKVSQSLLNTNDINLKLIVFSDVTESQQLIEDIEEREKIYRVLLETLPDGVVIINKNTKKYIYRNKYMIEQFKKIGIDMFNSIVEDYINSGEFDKVKITNLNKKENASIVITDIKSEDVYIIIFKILENNQKTEDIRERLKKRQESEDFKTQFCIDIVDKIDRPVDDMLTQNKIMKEKVESSIIGDHVDLVRQNLYRLKKVLDNINDIMAIENFKYDLNYTVFDVVRLIKDISNLSKYYIDRKCLNLELSFSDNKILVYLDSIKLQKIILNILSNAIKFTDKNGKIKISVDKKMDFIVISIKDNGIGIPKDQMNFIFENFEQVDRGLSRLAEGMGMGLYLVKQLAEIQDLYLNVESELNKGSEFKILIKNTENTFLKKKYKKDIKIEEEFVDIQFSDIYPA